MKQLAWWQKTIAYEAYPKSVVLGRMREVAKNICCCFDQAEKTLKAAR